MAATIYPLPRETRESTVLVGNGTVGPYGPSTYKIFDVEDVAVFAKVLGAELFSDVTEDVTITKTAGEAFDTFSVTFDAAVLASTQWYHQGKRTAERSLAVTRAGTIDTDQLERELSKIAVVQSEQRRDLDEVGDIEEAAATAAAAAVTATTAASTATGAASTATTKAAEASANAAAARNANAALLYAFSATTTDADPGAGTFRLNNANPALATAAYIDNVDADGVTMSGEIDTWDDSTNTVRGKLTIRSKTDASIRRIYNVTGSVVDGTGYRKLTLAYVNGAGTLSGDCFLIFNRSGDKGTDGAGSGDVVGPASSVNNRLAVFSGTSGKALADSGLLLSDVLDTADIGVSVQAYDAQLSSLLRQNSKSAAYTAVLADGGKHIFHPSADTTARIFTIPANASVAYPIGTTLTFINQNGAGVVTIAITSDTLRLAGAGTTGSRTLAANGIATAVKVTATEWIISGTGLT